jgi:hypothetical protein
MSWPELATRGRQELARRVDRWQPARDGRERPWWVLDRLAPGVLREAGAGPGASSGPEVMAGRLLEHFRQAGADGFFEGAVSPASPGVLERRMPGAHAATLASAASVLRGRFDLLGYRGLSFGDPIDWHLDPVSGRRAPLVHWSRLDPLDFDVVGDSKVVWELNRHQWLVELGQAYRLTGDERLARAFLGAVRTWLDANPPGLGINWASSLEVALRLVSWCWALHLFRGSPALTPELFAEILGSVWRHAAHVERYLSHYSSPNTHLTGEALGLFYAGLVFPVLRRAARWRDMGARILVTESERQVLADGVHFELSTQYHRYMVETYLHFVILAARHDLAVPAGVTERLGRMLDFLLAVRRPDGSLPQIGDADGGWLLPLSRRAPDDARGIFATAAGLLGRADCAWAAGGEAAETLWLLGPGGLETLRAIIPAPPGAPLTRVFTESGYVVMRSGWERDAHQLVLDAGPLGCPVSGGHGHADLLGIQLVAFGEPCLVDPGTHCYTASRQWRDHFRSSAAHSTVTIDGHSQAEPAGWFAWQERPRARLRRWVSTPVLDLADAEHTAYRRLPDPVTHRRRVVWVKPRYWVIVDDLAGAAEHAVEVRFQCAPLDVRVDPTLWGRVRGARGRGLLLRAFATVPLKAEVRTGEPAPIAGWVAPDYGRLEPAPVLVYSTVAGLPLRIVTLILPVPDPSGAPPAVSPLLDGGPGPSGLVFTGGPLAHRPGGPTHRERELERIVVGHEEIWLEPA